VNQTEHIQAVSHLRPTSVCSGLATFSIFAPVIKIPFSVLASSLVVVFTTLLANCGGSRNWCWCWHAIIITALLAILSGVVITLFATLSSVVITALLAVLSSVIITALLAIFSSVVITALFAVLSSVIITKVLSSDLPNHSILTVTLMPTLPAYVPMRTTTILLLSNHELVLQSASRIVQSFGRQNFRATFPH
jgi:hypothetical protein